MFTHLLYRCLSLLVKAGSSGHVHTLDDYDILNLIISEAYQILQASQITGCSHDWDWLPWLQADPDWTPSFTQTDRQTDRQADRQTGRQTGRQTDRHAGRQADRQTDR